MADYISEEPITRVDTGGMHEAAAIIETNLKAIKADQQELMDIQRALSLSDGDKRWRGVAGEAYSSVFHTRLFDAIAACNNHVFIPKDIEKYAEDYERAHGYATMTAESIENATWADV